MPANTSNLIARASTLIAAPAGKVWDALVTPAAIKQYMFGTTVVSDWKEGNPIVWKGEWQGKRYEDKGVIQQLKPGRALPVHPLQSARRAAGQARELPYREHPALGRGGQDPGLSDAGQQSV